MSQTPLFPLNKPESRIVIAVETKIGAFGNRTDLIVVDEGNVRGLSLLESDNPDAVYFNNQSPLPSGVSL